MPEKCSYLALHEERLCCLRLQISINKLPACKWSPVQKVVNSVFEHIQNNY